MHCFVYASQRKADSYLWLPRRDDFSSLPESLVLLLGEIFDAARALQFGLVNRVVDDEDRRPR